MDKPFCYMENSESKKPKYYKYNTDNQKHGIKLGIKKC